MKLPFRDIIDYPWIADIYFISILIILLSTTGLYLIYFALKKPVLRKLIYSFIFVILIATVISKIYWEHYTIYIYITLFVISIIFLIFIRVKKSHF